MLKENYFKKMKNPTMKLDEATPLIKETKKYFFIFLGASILFPILANIITFLGSVFWFLSMASLFIAAYFGIQLYRLNRKIKRLKNLTCDSCGAQLGDREHTKYKVISHHWMDHNGSSGASSKLYLDVEFKCICPVCGKEKKFTESLSSGSISSSSGGSIVTTEKVVDDYLNGYIRL